MNVSPAVKGSLLKLAPAGRIVEEFSEKKTFLKIGKKKRKNYLTRKVSKADVISCSAPLFYKFLFYEFRRAKIYDIQNFA